MSVSLLVLINHTDKVTSQVVKFSSRTEAVQAKVAIEEDFRKSVWAVRITILEGTA
ncbi:hypothetical protein vB_PsyM_KIL3b_0101 [Pseudomonas phage vB_PsyM_KIL3b]|uniref:Uncharacterized protein n=3 Tax=Pseudomonas phage vB_PsyM_KIL1 TaxID=1777065 RepID=A0A142IG11_9CAUD|nr:hypothetical protein BH774_gp102 [Pseudomonas phage vB_PsyM_KIL1]AMR57347.1 hypothetical protein vB_PsyM_KIL1_0100 [Pseudomonas phage vB_PsyM_KIL1]AMR57668.1 hypothetical protein vB_PsyM_KIL3_0101 [Pseudomonas phage vB_PsyM_KIL3]AMR58166.1 hypothetical protein vB_PsyM_KIL3b_0101 [Pseudomonas phage vB_PsyM_KIL3b]